MDRASPRVQLEVAFLDGDQAAPLPAGDEPGAVTVLVVAGEADVRRYVRECLRERSDLRLLEAATIAAALPLAAESPPRLVIVDEPERDVLVRLPASRAIVIVDDVPHGSPTTGARIRLMARPFTAERLVAEVAQLLD